MRVGGVWLRYHILNLVMIKQESAIIIDAIITYLITGIKIAHNFNKACIVMIIMIVFSSLEHDHTCCCHGSIIMVQAL